MWCFFYLLIFYCFHRYPRPLQTLWTTAPNTPEMTLSLRASLLQTTPSRKKNPALYCSGCHLAFIWFFFFSFVCLFVCFGLLMFLYFFVLGEIGGVDWDRIITMCSETMCCVPVPAALYYSLKILTHSSVWALTTNKTLLPSIKADILVEMSQQHLQSSVMDFGLSWYVHNVISGGQRLLLISLVCLKWVHAAKVSLLPFKVCHPRRTVRASERGATGIVRFGLLNSGAGSAQMLPWCILDWSSNT